MRNDSSSTPSPRSRTVGIWAGLAAVILAAGGITWWAWKSTQPPAIPEATTSPTTPPTATPDITQAPLEQTVQVYWLKPTDMQFELVPSPVTVNAPGQPDALLKAALEAMLKSANPPDSTPGLTSTVPQGTTLKQVAIKPDGVHVDLSQAFTTGGGSTSMTGRVGQVIYTATTLDPKAPVWLSVEGKPLEVLGGEGLVIDQPMTRDSFEQNFMGQ
jgi:spore germination protein GerM